MPAITLATAAPVEIVPAPTNPVDAYLSALGSVRSRQAMRRALDICAEQLSRSKATACPFHTLQPPHVVALRARLAERYAPATANLCLAALRGVLKACRRMGLITRDQESDLAEIEPVRGERVLAGRYIERAELRELFKACGADASGLRDAAAIALLAGYGVRREEAVTLELSSYDRGTGDLTVIHGKGGKQRCLPGGANAHVAINAWLGLRGDAPGPLLCPVSKGGKIEIRGMRTSSLHKRVKRIAKLAGVADLSAHSFRRSFASDLLDRGDSVCAQQLLGHSSPVTTARYDRRGERARRAAMAHVALPL